MPLSLYIHIPFCQHRCAYCDFNTYTTLFDLQDSYATALTHEIIQIGSITPPEEKEVQTIFFGGGTPSLMSIAQLEKILTAVRSQFSLLPDAEITLEANPDTVSPDYLYALRDIGINRLSFGVQSTLAHELTLLERTHSFATVESVVESARKAGFDSFNLDLIYGLPHQTLSDWKKNLTTILKLDPAHLSLYCLTIEPGTPMQQSLKKGVFPLPNPDIAADQYAHSCELLSTYGYEHYEISNWAKAGEKCKHNIAYWENSSYLGFGAGAHGHANGYRYSVVRQPRVYIRRLETEERPTTYPLSTAVAQSNQLSREEQISDTIITQLRLLHQGLDLNAFANQFQQSFHELFPTELARVKEWGLLIEKDNHLLLTEKGWFLSNQLFYQFI